MQIEVARSDELAEGVPVRVEAGGRELVLVRYQSRIYALDNVCPHRGGPMHQGEVVDGCLECPLHAWPFELSTGKMPGAGDVVLETFPVVEQDGRIYVEVAAP
ncbi:MAG: Rieske 2Fe-2S domain-containing protein [Myxococcota bacterium]